MPKPEASESTSASGRKAARSRRSIAAAIAVASGAVAVVAGIAVDVPVALAVAGAYAVVAGVVASVLLHGVVAQVRRLWAQDRADLAGAYRTAAVERSAEQVAFADSMAACLSERQARIGRLEADIHRAEKRREELGAALADEQERCTAFAAELEQVQHDLAHLRDALTASEAAEKRARAEVLVWESQSRQLA